LTTAVSEKLESRPCYFAGTADEGRKQGDKTVDQPTPRKPPQCSKTAINEVREFLTSQGASLDRILAEKGFALNAAIRDAKEAVNETMKPVNALKSSVERFQKIQSSTNISGINEYRKAHDAIILVDKSLKKMNRSKILVKC
jgi:type I restriction enzyme R subunit